MIISLGITQRYFQSGPAYPEYACIISAFGRCFRRTVVTAGAGSRVLRGELPLLQRAVSSVIIPSVSFAINKRIAAYRDW
jgi:hypothetical protein